MSKIKKIVSGVSALALALSLASCGEKKEDNTSNEASNSQSQVTETQNSVAEEANSGEGETSEAKHLRISMITDQGGVNDESFNQSAKEGFDELQDAGKIDFSVIESHKETDYEPNLESAIDVDDEEKSDIIFTVGFALADATNKAADENPDQKFAMIDNENTEEKENVVGIRFADHQNSFMVGYIAGMTTKTNNVGFVGGMHSDIIDRFEYGYKAGVETAAKERGEKIEVQAQYVDSFTDSAKGKEIANTMYQKGADIVFQAAGGSGLGVIEAAKESGNYAIGADMDQSKVAPDNVIVSTIKGVNAAVKTICEKYAKGEFDGGKTDYFTLEDGDALTVAYGDNGIVSDETKDKVEKLRQDIIDGKVEVPENEDDYTSMGYGK